MRGTEVYGILGSALSENSTRLNAVFLEEYHRQMDEMFARMHARTPSGGFNRAAYDKYMKVVENDLEPIYHRFEFEKRSDANRFVNDMIANGVDVALAPHRIHGKILLEVPVEYLTKAGDVAQTATLINAYKTRTGAEVNGYSWSQDYGDAQGAYSADRNEDTGTLSGATVGFMTREMDMNLGEIGRIAGALRGLNSLLVEDGDLNQEHAFTAALRHDKHGKTEGGHFTGLRGDVKKAVVLHSGTVVMDGKDITNTRTGQRMLEAHKERLQASFRHQQEYTASGGVRGAARAVKRQFRFSKDNERIKQNTDAIRQSMWKQTYASTEHEYGRFNGGTLDRMRNAYGEEAIKLKEFRSKVEIDDDTLGILTKLQLAPNNHLSETQNNFINDLKKKVCDEGETVKFTYDDTINIVNILMLAQAKETDTVAKGGTFLSVDENAALLAGLERAEKGGQFRLSKAESVMFPSGFSGSKSVKGQLDAIREDLGVDLNFASLRGRTMSEEHITHIDKDLVAALAANGVTFNAATGRFVKSGAALNHDEIRNEIRELGNVAGISNREQRHWHDLADRMDEKADLFGYKITGSGQFVHHHGADITRADMLKLDRAFLQIAEAHGYNFITAAKTFDYKSLEKLDVATLRSWGFKNPEAVKQAMLRFHANDGGMIKQKLHGGTAGWGTHNFKLAKSAVRKGTSLTQKLTGGSRLSGEQGDEETQQALSAYRSIGGVPNHVKTVHIYAKQYSDAVGQRINAFKMKHSNHNAAHTRRTSTRTPSNKAARRPVNKGNSREYLSKQEERLARIAGSERRWEKLSKFAEKFDIKKQAKKKFLSTKLGSAINTVALKIKGFLIKVVAVFLGAYFKFCGGVLAVVIVLSMIQALLNLPYEGLKRVVDWASTALGQKPAIITLHDYMNDDLQEKWLDGIRDFEGAYDHFDAANYTVSYADIDSYLTHFTNLQHRGDYLYINPFHDISTSVPEENLTKVVAYDGINDTQIITNPSVYGEKDGTEGFVSTESGHTNNIKDILAMVDVMYQFNIDKLGSDEQLHSILNENPAVINFENFWNNTVGFFKWLGSTIWNFFTGDEIPSLDDYWGGTVRYGTIQNYCSYLYEASHQEQINLDVNYYPIKPFMANIEGTMTDISGEIDQACASQLGICNHPEHSDFKVAYNGSKATNKIYPYMLNDSGAKVDLSIVGNADVIIAVNSAVNGSRCTDSDICLWDSMAADEPTYNIIHDRATAWFGSDCWKEDTAHSRQDYESRQETSGWFDDVDDAIDDAKSKIRNYRDNTASLDVETPYELSADHNSFVRVSKERVWENFQQVGSTSTQQVEDGTEYERQYWTGTGGAGTFGGGIIWIRDSADNGGRVKYGTVKIYHLADDGNSYYIGKSAYIDDTSSFRWVANDDDKWELHWNVAGEDEDHVLVAGDTSYRYDYETEFPTREVTKYKTQHKVTYKADIIRTNTEAYKRECEGHEFEYCGGHVGCHMKGVVYSTTNEQIIMSGMQKNANMTPKALDYEMAEHGYDKMKGKVIKKEVDYSTLTQATHTGGCPTPLEDAQGSNVNRGLNLWVDGDTLKKGLNVRTDIAPQCIRDIFDVDSMIDKGGNVFPWKNPSDTSHPERPRWTQYEGWTADNITFVAMRIAIDWNELYDFDIPLEIGAVSISEDDIKLISDALAQEYGSSYSTTRKEAVEMALSWVGRGHYSDQHHDHDFLKSTCLAHTISREYNGVSYDISYDANCTASDSLGFINYYMAYWNNGSTANNEYTSWGVHHGYSSFLPADMVRRSHWMSDDDINTTEFDDDDLDYGGIPITTAITEMRDTDTYMVYIGTLDNYFNGLTDDDGNPVTSIELSNGYVIHKGVPMLVGMAAASANTNGLFGHGSNGCGTIFFRSEASTGFGQTGNEQIPYWMTSGSFINRRYFNEVAAESAVH